ncbi:MAG: hypothetical protein ABSC48_00155 [Terracidiphilus sp.]|jgi:hypothetical protein
MTLIPANSGRLERLYALALRLYPERFREAHAPAMRQVFRDALNDSTLPRRVLIPLILRDLAASLAKEHLAMLRDTFARPVLLYNALVLTGLSTGLALALYAIPQQVLRQGANDPQIAMATDLVSVFEQGDIADLLQQGTLPGLTAGSGGVDMARSLSPFVIVYDDQGRPLASQAQLDGKAPALPSGVFDFVRQHGEERLSWQPRRGVRIAAVVQRVGGAHPGFVLAGRSLREVEVREEQVRQMAGVTWIGMLGVILVGTAAFGWYTRPKTA